MSRSRLPRLPLRPGEAGESLVELLISFTIIGTSVVMILGGVLFAVDSAKLDQRSIHAQALLRSWGEYVVAQTTDASFIPCGTASDYETDLGRRWAYTQPAPPAGLERLPAGFTAEITKVDYSDGAKFVDSCDPKFKVQRLQLSVTVTSSPSFTTTYDVVVRRPCSVSDSGCIT